MKIKIHWPCVITKERNSELENKARKIIQNAVKEIKT